MIFTIALYVFVVACCTLVYTWLLYPATMLWLLRRQPLSTATAPPPLPNATQAPHVSVIIAAWNEEAVIADRIANLEALHYPRQSMTILIGTDGCTDATAARARARAAASPLQIQLQEYPRNRGKASVLKDLVAQALAGQPATGTTLVFTDANTSFAPDAIAWLLARLQDAQVGGVCGQLLFEQHQQQPENTYWSMETRLKQAESYYDACLGANGAIYAIRSSCFWQQLPPRTIIDDFVLGMKVRESGLRMVFEPRARAYEELPQTADEWRRRVRIGSGAFQALAWCRTCLAPRYGCFALFFWSHKVLRWFTPHLYLIALLAAMVTLQTQPQPNRMLAAAPAALIALSLLFLLVVLLHPCLPPAMQPLTIRRIIAGCHHFARMQAALLAGFLRFCRGNLSGAWQRTPRSLREESAP